MKIYSCPDECPAPTFEDYDYNAKPGDPKHWQTLEAEHTKRLRGWLCRNGYTGKNSGKVVSFGVADGCAQYMLAEGGGKTFLIHLPYGDAWQYDGVQYMPKKAILERIQQEEKFAELFSKPKEPA